MEKRKLNQLLELLDEKELRKFEKWVETELDGRQKKTVQLLRLIKGADSIDHIWAELFPDRPVARSPYMDSGFRRLEHQLVELVEKYLSIQAFSREQEYLDLFLIRELNFRNAGNLFHQKISRVEARLTELDARDENYYHQLYRFQREKLHFLLKSNRKEAPAAFRQLNERFETWWFHEKLRMALVNLNYQMVFNEPTSTGVLIEEIMASAAQIDYLKRLPVLDLYRSLFSLLQEGDTYENLFDLIESSGKSLSRDALTDVFNLMLNFFTRKTNQTGKDTYLAQLFRMYEWGIRDGFLLIDGVLSWQHYKNLLTAGLRLGYTDKVWTYMHELKPMLPPQDQEEAFELHLAKYHIATQNYSLAKRILSRKFSNVFYEATSRMALIKIRYEQGIREDLENELRALRVYLERQPQLSTLAKKSWINEIRLIEKLIRIFTREEKQRLQVEIEKTQPLGNREWLLAQVAGD